jgi:hypothetical protein
MMFGDSGARLIRLVTHADERGQLTVGEAGHDLPFQPVRFFTIHDVPAGARRGDHAVDCDLLLLAVAGSVMVGIHDGKAEYRCRLDRPDVALYLPPNIFNWQYDFSAGCVLLALASRPYAAVRYISGLDEYLRRAPAAARSDR